MIADLRFMICAEDGTLIILIKQVKTDKKSVITRCTCVIRVLSSTIAAKVSFCD
jgi:hypothetical protein